MGSLEVEVSRKNLAEFKRLQNALKRFSERHFTTVFTQSYIKFVFHHFFPLRLKATPLIDILLKNVSHTLPVTDLNSI